MVQRTDSPLILALTESPDRPEAALLGSLRQHGFRVVACGNPLSDRFLALTERGVECVSLTSRGRIDLIAAWRVRKLIDTFAPACIHAFTGRMVSAAVLALTGKKVPLIAYRGTAGHVSRWDPTSWLGFMNPKVRKILCVSDAVREYLIGEGVSPEKAITIYKGHAPEWYTPSPREALGEFGVGPEELVVVCNANMRPVKGVDTLIEAMMLLPDTVPCRLLLIGEVLDPVVTELLRSDRVHRRCVAAGPRSDAAALVGACNIFVMASKEREGLPKALLEAMFQGVPPIVTNVGGMPEVVEDGVSGIVVPPHDPEALKVALVQLLTSVELRITVGRAARARAREAFSIQRTIDETVKVYRELMGEQVVPE